MRPEDFDLTIAFLIVNLFLGKLLAVC